MNTHTIGIDFGTSKTLVSHINPQTQIAETIRLGRGSDYLPTSIYIDNNGQFLFGDDADDMIEENSNGLYLRGFKMQLGSDTPLHMYTAPDGTFCMPTAKDLVKHYLHYIKQLVEERVYMGESVTGAVITRPVNFTAAQCHELKSAAQNAGFSHVEFTTEPEAAGLAFCRMQAAKAFKGNALIVDWGGGTLDFALVTRQGDKVCTHKDMTDGDTTMGGEKFDECLWMYTDMQMKQKGINLDHLCMMPKVRKGKEQLSVRTNTTLRLSHSGGACPPLTIERELFNRMIKGDINKAVEKVKALLSKIPTQYKPEMLILVGGSSQIPLIKTTLESACNLPTVQWINAREAVALGAALWLHKAPVQGSDKAKENSRSIVSHDEPPKNNEQKEREKEAYKVFRDGMKCQYKEDYDTAASLFAKAYDKGDLSAGWMLAHCYQSGFGVPRNYKKMMEIAHQLIEKGCGIGYSYYVNACNEGQGAQLDPNQAKIYEETLLKTASAPIAGVDEEIRFLALLSGCSDPCKLPIFADEYIKVSKSPDKKNMYVVQLLNYLDENSENIERIRRLIDESIAAGSSEASALKGLLTINRPGIFNETKQQGLQRLQSAANNYGAPGFVIYAAYENEQNEDTARELLNKFWKTCNYGNCHQVRKDRLPCELELVVSTISGYITAPPMNRLENIIQSGTLEEIMNIYQFPTVRITNQSNKTYKDLVLRLHERKVGYHDLYITEKLTPHGSIDIDLNDDHEINLNNCHYMELFDYKSGKNADFIVGDFFQDLTTFTNDSFPAVIMAWEKGLWGGIVLKLKAIEGSVRNIDIIKSNNKALAHIDLLTEHEWENAGWMEFSDDAGLTLNEQFYLITQDYSPVLGIIIE